jgi:hypothetical protein
MILNRKIKIHFFEVFLKIIKIKFDGIHFALKAFPTYLSSIVRSQLFIIIFLKKVQTKWDKIK